MVCQRDSRLSLTLTRMVRLTITTVRFSTPILLALLVSTLLLPGRTGTSLCLSTRRLAARRSQPHLSSISTTLTADVTRIDVDYYIPAGALIDADGYNADGTLINPVYQRSQRTTVLTHSPTMVVLTVVLVSMLLSTSMPFLLSRLVSARFRISPWVTRSPRTGSTSSAASTCVSTAQ